MVLAYYPQRMRHSLSTNSSYSPQGVDILGTLLLDLFPGALAAYSLRLLRTEYFGPAIRVIRTSDSAEQDIGFLADGSLDVPALTSFVGASDGMVKIIYDQSTNNFDLDAQIIIAKMPKIILAGILQTTNALPAILFDGGDDVLYSTSTIPSPAAELFVFGVWQKLDLANNLTAFNLDSPNVTINRRCTGFVPNQNGSIIWDAGDALIERLITVPSFNDLMQHQYTLLKTVGTDNQKIRRDGMELIVKTPVTIPTLVNNIIIGGDRPNTASAGNMNWQEFIFYNTNVLGSVSGIETNEINHWSETMFIVTNLGDQIVTDTGDNLVIV